MQLFTDASGSKGWGAFWSNCDNNTVVEIWQKGSTHCKEIMALVRLLYFCVAQYNIHIMITHIAGINNNIADAISRFQMERFSSLAPAANLQSDPIRALPTLTSANCGTNASP